MQNNNIKKELKQYIDENILPLYEKNDLGHNIDHALYVINRSLKFANISDVDSNMVYTIAAYHDCGHSIDPKNHEAISANILYNDSNLCEFFTQAEIKLMKEAVEDHRASLEYEPRSIYGKIVSSADRNTSIDSVLKRTYDYCIKNCPNNTIEETIQSSLDHIIEKFGSSGYAKEKMFFQDDEYEGFLEVINALTKDNKEFVKRYKKVNKLD